jgi:hypothetical protein
MLEAATSLAATLIGERDIAVLQHPWLLSMMIA